MSADGWSNLASSGKHVWWGKEGRGGKVRVKSGLATGPLNSGTVHTYSNWSDARSYAQSEAAYRNLKARG